jgi:hypothetical protein
LVSVPRMSLVSFERAVTIGVLVLCLFRCCGCWRR